MLVKTISSAPVDVDATQGIIKGYFAHFGTKDSDGDIIQKSAFDKTVKENGPAGTNRIKHYFNHDSDRPLGAMKELGADDTGLAYVSQLLKYKGKFITDAEVVLAGIESGYNLEHSIGYWIPKGKSQPTNDGNLLIEIGLYEGSTLTKHGANGNTPITGLKAHTDVDMISLYTALEKALHRGDWREATYEILQKHHDAVGIALKAHLPTEPPRTQPETKADSKAIADLITNSLKFN